MFEDWRDLVAFIVCFLFSFVAVWLISQALESPTDILLFVAFFPAIIAL